MAVRFILGRAGSGKTRWCLDAITARLADPSDTGRLILLVPEQASLQMERTLAPRAPGGGYMRAAVLSFSRLTQLAVAQGSTPPEVPSGARRLILRRLVIENADQLRTLRRAVGLEGFFIELDGIIETLLRENVEPAALRAVRGRLESPARLEDLILLYERYREWLGPDRLDAAARLALVRARLDRLDWLRGASLWVDGFAGFTGQERETLVALARAAREIAVTLLVDPRSPPVVDHTRQPDPVGLFSRTELTYQRLVRDFERAGVPIESPVVLAPPALPRFTASAALGRLEAALVARWGDERGRDDGPTDPAAVHVYGCASPRAEVRAAAEWIRTRLADAAGPLRFRDFALIARDISPYAPLVAEIFDELEIPYFLDQRRPLRSHPLFRLISALTAAAAGDLDVGSAVQLLRTRLLPISRDAHEQLECLILRHDIAGVEAWRAPHWTLEGEPEPLAAFPAERATVAAGVGRLRSLLTSGPCDGRSFARTCWEAVAALGVQAALEGWIAEARSAGRHESAELHRLAWSALCEQLDEIVDTLGDTALPADAWPPILESGLADVTLGLAPPTLDQVLVSAIERSRHPDVKHAWILGFNAGVFPARPADDRLLATPERERLAAAGLDALGPARDEAFGERLLAYIALTRPSHGLVVSYAQASADGQTLEPSPLLADVLAALPGLRVESPPADDPPSTLAGLARLHLRARGDARLAAMVRRTSALIDLCRHDPAHAARLDRLLRGLRYDNAPGAVGESTQWRGSISQVETFIACPFKHFARYRLRLDPQRRPQAARWDLGDIAHDVLAAVTRAAMNRPGGVRGIGPDGWRELLKEALASARAKWPPDFAQRRGALAAFVDALEPRLIDLALAHGARWKRGHFEPRFIETPLGDPADPGGLPRIVLDIGDGGRIELEGRVDRVDVARLDDLTLALLYDYKSSTEGGFSKPYLTDRRLQLFSYLLAACRWRDDGRRVAPAGVLIAPLYQNQEVIDKGYFADADEGARLMYLHRPEGIIAEPAAPLLDQSLPTLKVASPVADMRCTKDGGYYANCDVKPAGQIDALVIVAEQTIRQAGTGLAGGDVAVSPLVEDRRRACLRCDFQTVCRFDPAYNRTRHAERDLPQATDAHSGDSEGGR